jgi:hypothetical protein
MVSVDSGEARNRLAIREIRADSLRESVNRRFGTKMSFSEVVASQQEGCCRLMPSAQSEPHHAARRYSQIQQRHLQRSELVP